MSLSQLIISDVPVTDVPVSVAEPPMSLLRLCPCPSCWPPMSLLQMSPSQLLTPHVPVAYVSVSVDNFRCLCYRCPCLSCWTLDIPVASVPVPFAHPHTWGGCTCPSCWHSMFLLQVSLSQLLTTHVPTVWAIDQYRIYKEVWTVQYSTVQLYSTHQGAIQCILMFDRRQKIKRPVDTDLK